MTPDGALGILVLVCPAALVVLLVTGIIERWGPEEMPGWLRRFL